MNSAQDIVGMDVDREDSIMLDPGIDDVMRSAMSEDANAAPAQPSTNPMFTTAINFSGSGRKTKEVLPAGNTASLEDELEDGNGSGDGQLRPSHDPESSHTNKSVPGNPIIYNYGQYRCHMRDCWGTFMSEEGLEIHLAMKHPEDETRGDIIWEVCPLERCNFKYARNKQVKNFHEHLERHGTHMEFGVDNAFVCNTEDEVVGEYPLGKEYQGSTGHKKSNTSKTRKSRTSTTAKGKQNPLHTTVKANPDLPPIWVGHDLAEKYDTDAMNVECYACPVKSCKRHEEPYGEKQDRFLNTHINKHHPAIVPRFRCKYCPFYSHIAQWTACHVKKEHAPGAAGSIVNCAENMDVSDEVIMLDDDTMKIDQATEIALRNFLSSSEVNGNVPEHNDNGTTPTPVSHTFSTDLPGASTAEPFITQPSLQGHLRSFSNPQAFPDAFDHPGLRKRQRGTYGAVDLLNHYHYNYPVRPQYPNRLPNPLPAGSVRTVSNPFPLMASPQQIALLNSQRSTYGAQALLSQHDSSGLNFATTITNQPRWPYGSRGHPLQPAARLPRVALDQPLNDPSPNFRSMDGQRVPMGTAQSAFAGQPAYAAQGISRLQRMSMQTGVGAADYRVVLAQMANEKAVDETEGMGGLPRTG